MDDVNHKKNQNGSQNITYIFIEKMFAKIFHGFGMNTKTEYGNCFVSHAITKFNIYINIKYITAEIYI